MIKLFESTEKEFKTNGLGGLNDAISCVVKEVLNGEYELEMTYPITGVHYSELKLRRIILANPNKYDQSQPFRIYAISKPINGVVTINAEHISYDLSGIPVFPAEPYYVVDVSNAMSYMMTNSAVEHPFNLIPLMFRTGDMDTRVPRTIRAMLGTDENSILSVYGGEYMYDRFDVILTEKRGANRGVVISYGKNLTDIKQEENCAGVYTGVCPYYYAESDGFQYLDEKIVYVEGSFDYNRIMPLDLTSEFDEMPTQDQLRTKTKEYIEKNKIGVPKVSLTVSFASIHQDTDLDMLEDVRLGDTVLVKFLKLGVDTESECISISYDPISNKYITIELGEPVDSLTDTISNTVKDQNIIKDTITDTNINLDKVSVNVQKNADSLVAEVSRASSAEANLSSQISITASEISSKVSRGDVVSEINQSADTIRLTSNRLVVDTDKFSLDGDGSMETLYAKLKYASIAQASITESLFYSYDNASYSLIQMSTPGETSWGSFKNKFNGSVDCWSLTVQGTPVVKQGDTVALAAKATNATNASYASSAGSSSSCSTGYLTLSSGTLSADSGSLWIGQNTVRANTIEQTSSARYKKEIEDYSGNALSVICESRIREYRYLDEPDQEQVDEYKNMYDTYEYKKHIGVVVEEVDNSVITQCGNGIDMGAMVSIAWKAIQELHQENVELRNELSLIKQNMEVLQNG